MTIAELKACDMVSYLSQIGFNPLKIRGADYWYLSPLRAEKTASFKVNRVINRWYDHGLGKGGNLVDFGVLFFNCSVYDLLQIFGTDLSFQSPFFWIAEQSPSKITILNHYPIASYGLVKYLSERKIPQDLADRFCTETLFTVNRKTYYALGFKNDLGGYELRNAFMKLSSSPKAVSTFNNGADTLCVVEGFFDFLSYLRLFDSFPFHKRDYLVLNSLSFFERSFPLMERYNAVELFMNQDASGQNCSRIAQEKDPSRYCNKSHLYNGYGDLNELLVAVS